MTAERATQQRFIAPTREEYKIKQKWHEIWSKMWHKIKKKRCLLHISVAHHFLQLPISFRYKSKSVPNYSYCLFTHAFLLFIGKTKKTRFEIGHVCTTLRNGWKRKNTEKLPLLRVPAAPFSPCAKPEVVVWPKVDLEPISFKAGQNGSTDSSDSILGRDKKSMEKL